MTIRLSEKAMYTTVKLTVEKPECSETATGFIFKYFRNEKDSLPVIVTNTHVISGWKRIAFLLNRGDEENRPMHGDPINEYFSTIFYIVLFPFVTYCFELLRGRVKF